ncbi:MAG: sulfatase [Vicinamibacteria bacterium]|nr:sulfatase [Vicinamibacteria bacterium]
MHDLPRRCATIRPVISNRALSCVLLLGLVGASCGGSGLASPSPAPTTSTTPAPVVTRPNIVLVLLDDGEEAMTSNMPRIRASFIDKGLRFTNAFANTPLCGPSRSNILSGQFSHNTGVIANTGDGAGYPTWAQNGYDAANIGPWLKAAGYRTGIFGKYQNDYPTKEPPNETYVPPGWDDWRVVMSDRVAYNDYYTLNENGTLTTYSSDTGGYQADILSARLQSFLKAAEANDSQPFFAFLSLGAPHTPTAPAARHLSAYPGATAPRGASFNEPDLSDKPRWLQDQSPLMDSATIAEIDSDYRGSLQAMLSVEDATEALFQTLDQLGESSNTYVFFTSDNGLHRGEHRLRGGKNTAFEESIRMPFYVRGPGVPAGRTIDHLAGLVDLVPTFLSLAGASIPGSVDGMSLTPLLSSTPPALSNWRQEMLVEHPGGAGLPIRIPAWYGLRTQSEIYVEYDNGENEYYDLKTDPLELNNLARQTPSSTLSRLSARLAVLKACRGAACRP